MEQSVRSDSAPAPTRHREDRDVDKAASRLLAEPPRDGGTDWASLAADHPGFLPYPFDRPRALLRLDLIIPAEASRMLGLAREEVERRRAAYVGSHDPDVWPRVAACLRREMRMDLLELVASDVLEEDGSDGMDPMLVAIEKDRALAAEHIRLLNISGHLPDEDPSWDPTHEASDLQWTHWRDVLLHTVPTTLAGCVATARYAAEWVEREGLDLSEDGPKLFALLARSPALHGIEPPSQLLTMEGAASLAFEPYELDTALRNPREWAAEFTEHSIGMHLADKLLRMGKSEAVSFVQDADRRDGKLPEVLMKSLSSAREALDGWARVLSVAEARFLVAASSAAIEAPGESGEVVEPPSSDTPKHGYLPAPEGIGEGSYGLRIDEEGVGLHAPPGSTAFVEPDLPQGAGLAVLYRHGMGPRIWDLTHAFDPALYAPGEVRNPMLQVCDPVTGQLGQIDATLIEKIHRVFGIYVPVDVAERYGPAPTPLPVLEMCPEGMFEQVVTDRSAYPLLRPTETAIVDPARREPTHGALCVLQWSGGSRSVLLTNRRALQNNPEAWWVDPVNRPRSREAWAKRMGGVPTMFASDGPYDAGHLAEKIIGTVVGVLGRSACKGDTP